MRIFGGSRGRRMRAGGKSKFYFGAGVAMVIVTIVVLLTKGTRWPSVDIVLPENLPDAAGLKGEDTGGQWNVVEIVPETVQPAIATLTRPLSYCRTQTVETFWSGGSGKAVYQVYVSGKQTRLDTSLSDGSVRHTLIVGTSAAVWYDEEPDWTVCHTHQLTADAMGRMLTYETVRDLPADQIAQADYRSVDGVKCIYVETCPDSGGYVSRYWIGVEWGLLYAAERTCNGEMIYRFSSTPPEIGSLDGALFLLPDGTQLEMPEEG